MINPRSIITWSQKFVRRSRGEKFYRAGFEAGSFTKFSSRQFKTATDAGNYAAAVIARWSKLYDAAILSMLPVQEPTP